MLTYGLTCVNPPAEEPITVDLLAQQLRLNTTDEYELLGNYITSARQLFEEYTGRALCWQEWTATYHLHHHHKYLGFPYPFQFPEVYPNHIVLPIPKPPLQAIRIFTVNDLQIADYDLDSTIEPAIIRFKPEFNGTQIKAPWKVEITFICGYTAMPTPSLPPNIHMLVPPYQQDELVGIPKLICQAILLQSASYYLHREEDMPTLGSIAVLPSGFKSICNLYKVRVF